MSRFEHQFFRKSAVAFTPRPARTNSGAMRYRIRPNEPKPVLDEKFSWWWSRYADLVDRRNSDGTYKPREKPALKRVEVPRSAPEMVAREDGMTRQTQRRLYRAACKAAGLPFRKSA